MHNAEAVGSAESKADSRRRNRGGRREREKRERLAAKAGQQATPSGEAAGAERRVVLMRSRGWLCKNMGDYLVGGLGSMWQVAGVWDQVSATAFIMFSLLTHIPVLQNPPR